MTIKDAIRFIFNAISEGGGEARFVGGCVRDMIHFGKDFHELDLDIAVNLPVLEVASLLRDIGAKIITKYVTNITVYKGHVFEITSTRKDIECYGRDVKVEFTPSFEEDSLRRDFTINALYMSLNRKIHDYHDGIGDLSKGVVQFIGNAENRIKEDYLRILRFFRFSAGYSSTISLPDYKACIELQGGLSVISKERIVSEMLKIMKYGKDATPTLETMKKLKIFEDINPQALQSIKSSNAFLKLAAITSATQCADIFTYTKQQKRFLNQFHLFSPIFKDQQGVFYTIYTLGRSEALKFLELDNAIHAKNHDISYYDTVKLPQVPIEKKDVFETFGAEGMRKKIYNKIIKKFIESKFSLDKENLLDWARGSAQT